MRERITKIKQLIENGIDKQLFFKLVLHITDGTSEFNSGYANYKKINEWQDLYSSQYVNLQLSETQLILFFDYLKIYYSEFVGNNHNDYFVFKTFINNYRTESYLEFESIVFSVFEIL
jgi:hypothetical protein